MYTWFTRGLYGADINGERLETVSSCELQRLPLVGESVDGPASAAAT